MEYFQEEAIGVECNPRCGGCKYGKFSTGAKQMTIKEEKDLEHFKSLMYLDNVGTTKKDPGPY